MTRERIPRHRVRRAACLHFVSHIASGNLSALASIPFVVTHLTTISPRFGHGRCLNTHKCSVAKPATNLRLSHSLSATRKSQPVYYVANSLRAARKIATPSTALPISRRRGNKMLSHLRFITTPTSDTPGTCMILHFDHRRYLIGNIHEGLQRACIQTGTKIHKVEHVFLTGKTEWRTTGGLMGLILTMADSLQHAAMSEAAAAQEAKLKAEARETQRASKAAGKKELAPTGSEQFKVKPENGPDEEHHRLTIHGGNNLAHTIATARKFMFRTGLPIDVNEIRDTRDAGSNWKPTWEDEFIRVWAMPIEPSHQSPSRESSSPKSPPKRSFEEFQGDDATAVVSKPHSGKLDMPTENEIQSLQACKNVVSEMFESDWRLDVLHETNLYQVPMPARVFVRNPDTKSIELYNGPMPGGDATVPDIKVLIRRPWPGALVASLPATKPSPIAMSYIIRNQPTRGKFDPIAAIALKVPRGPLFSRLAEGLAVKSIDGDTVLPEQVLGPTQPGNGVAIVEIPSSEYVQNLVNRPEWEVPEVMSGVEAIVWILGPNVAHDRSLKKFMAEHQHLKHVISAEGFCPNHISLDSVASATIRLNQIDPDRYPIPVHSNVANPLPVKSCMPAKRGLRILIQPTVTVQDEFAIPVLNTASVLLSTPKTVLSLAKQVKQEIGSDKVQKSLHHQDLPSPDAEIITLGTGSALPSKYRNVSATLLRVPGCGSYLIDCGEDTLGQLSRVYPPEELLEVLRDLKMIWISHMHADHHLGTTSIIKAWQKANYRDACEDYTLWEESSRDLASYLDDGKKLFIAAEPAMTQWIKEYSSVENLGCDKLVLLDSAPGGLKWNGGSVGFNTPHPELNRAMRMATGLENIGACAVSHCTGAQAVALTFPTGFKFAYSGDCRPSKYFARIGRGATVLLHEATFDDDMAGDAVAKKHSTTSEAIGVGLAMEARRVILTHFSQRYQKIPVMDGVHQQEVGFEDDESSGISDSSVVRDGKIADRPPHDGMKVAVAFDYMRIKVKDIALMERFRPVLLKLYETASVLDDEVGRPPTDETQPGRDLRQAKPKQKQKPQTQQRHVAKATRPTA